MVTILYIASLCIPITDTGIKTLSATANIISGTMLTVLFIHDMSLVVTWGLAIITGGGIETISHLTTTAIITGSTLATIGIVNITLPMIEGVSAITMVNLALLFQLLIHYI